MNVRRLQGLALILSAVCFVIGLFGPQSLSLIGPEAGSFFQILGIILFMLGIPAIYSVQPSGWMGVVGIILLEIGALIPPLFSLNMVPPGLADSLSLTSALAGTMGAIVTGWLTIRGNVFPAWLGWAFIAQGLLNFFTGMFNLGSLRGAIPILLPALFALVQLAYGYFIIRRPARRAIAGEAEIPMA